MTAPGKSKRRSGTAKWHMSRRAVSLSMPEVVQWTDRQCMSFLVKARWGDWSTVVCPHCGTIGRHYFRCLEQRWKCAGCGSGFSVTSQTVFSGRRMSLQQLVGSTLLWANSAGGQPALELKRHFNTTYNTAFTFQGKIREGLLRSYNVGLLTGDIEVDGAHQSGRRSAEKRGKPQGAPPASTDEKALTETMLTQGGQIKARTKARGALDPEFGRRLPKDRRIVMVACKRSGVPGAGACGTRVAIGLSETADVAAAFLSAYGVPTESCLNTDTSPAYTELGKRFRCHRTVEHAKELRGPNGENNNQAESFNFRLDRAERGTHLNIEPKYLAEVSVEGAFRSDTRKLPNGDQALLALHHAMSVGHSLYWRGFTHGHHRHVELLIPKPREAPSSGPPKGRHPISQQNGRPPR